MHLARCPIQSVQTNVYCYFTLREMPKYIARHLLEPGNTTLVLGPHLFHIDLLLPVEMWPLQSLNTKLDFDVSYPIFSLHLIY